MANKAFEVKVKGLKETQADMKRLGPRAGKALAPQIVQEAENIIGDGKEEVPVDTGNLRETGHVQHPIVTETNVSVQAGFGGPAAGYAEKVHEDLDARHNPGQKAKYLEDPYKRALPGMDQRIASALRKEFA
jgi:hypothetical protein